MNQQSTIDRQDSRELPLSGITVIEIGQNVAAPTAGLILADLGATVIKVEKSAGDDARQWGPPFLEGVAAVFQALNRNKQSVCLNFRDANQVSALKALILDRADVVIQSMRPGLLETQGLESREILETRPDLVWCDLGAFGGGGPLSKQPGYDPLMQAYGGLMSVTGEPERQPVRTGYSVIDSGTGMWAVIAIQAALLRRHRSGRGGMVDVSLYETALSWMTVPAAQYQGSGNLPGKHGSGAEMIAPYRAYQTSDGHMVVAAGNNNLFRLLAHALSHPEWATDERFADNPQRVVNRHVLDQLIESCMHVQTNAHWSECLTRAGVPVAPVQNIAQVIESEQTQALDMLQVVPGTNMTLMGLPIRFDGQRPSIRHAAPALNADAKVLQAYSEGALGT